MISKMVMRIMVIMVMVMVMEMMIMMVMVMVKILVAINLLVSQYLQIDANTKNLESIAFLACITLILTELAHFLTPQLTSMVVMLML